MRAAHPMTIALLLVVVACGGSGADSTLQDEPISLPDITGEELEAMLQESDRPAVVNVWASWCLPCRAEAPLLDEAFASHGSEVDFIGVDVQDNREDAREFLDEFGLEFEHFFDPDRSVPNHFAGIGTPITFFFASDGTLLHTHNGVIDERTLALQIDELLALESS